MAKSARERARAALASARHTSSKLASKAKHVANSRRSPAARSGEKLHVYSNVSNRRVRKDTKARKKAQYLASLPKSRIKRFFYRMHPKRFFKYWFSKEGALMALKLMGIGFAVLAVLLLGVFAYFRKDLPSPEELHNRLLNQTTKFYDRTGTVLLYEVYGDENRTVVEFEQISPHVKNATVAIEDKDFYHHGGFSLAGIVRAGYNNVFNKDAVTQGGSTITQQFIKNALLSPERTFTRKVKELILSVELERLYSKDEILAFYLNEISYGAQAYGIEAASQSYFDKTAAELTLDESAMLAAMPQAPTYYSPYGENTGELIERRDYILQLMVDQGYATQEEADIAKATDTIANVTPLEQRSLYRDIKAPHFVLEVQRQLEAEFGAAVVNAGGLTVITTLDWPVQQLAEQSVAENIDSVVNPARGGHGDNTALSATDVPTGQVVAQVGSRDFNHPGYGSFNAALAGRQPGSSFKPYGYSQLFTTENWGPGSIIWDTPTDFGGGYKPNNFDFKFPGKMKVREALGRSRNIPAVKALYIGGVDNVIELARSMGNKSLCNTCDYGLSLVLGAGEVKLAEHVHGYSTFARGGKYKEQTYTLKVTNANGEVLKEWQDSEGEQVLDPQVAYLTTSILSDDEARSGTFGRNSPDLVVQGLKTAVKTGTTDASRDGWMMGYSDCLAVGVWVGNHDNKPMNSITSRQTGPIWTSFVRNAHELKQCGKNDILARPEGIKDVTLDSNSGRLANANTTAKHSDIFPSWYKPAESGSATKQTIDIVSKKLATECTPPRAKQETTSNGVVPEIPPTDPSFARWSASTPYGNASGSITEKDDVHKCSDAKPTVSLSMSGTSTMSASVTQGTHALGTLNFLVDGTLVSSQGISGPGSYSFTPTVGSGNHSFAVEVIDAALYDSSDTKSYSVAGLELSVDGSPGGNNVSFSWTSYAGASNYTLCWTYLGGAAQVTPNGCDNTGSTSMNKVLLSVGSNWRATVTSNNGASSTKDFTNN